MAAKKTKQVEHNKPLGIGDTVALKSGGPTMTINNIAATQPRAAECQWFVNGYPQKETFTLETLTRRDRKVAKRRRPYVY
jgi:uncharacterized protein YodC (DUF2158 family)